MAAWERHLSFMDDRESYRAQVVAGVAASWRSPSSTQRSVFYCTGVHVLTVVFLGIVLAAPAFAEDR